MAADGGLRKTVETVGFSLRACATSLKRGVNERRPLPRRRERRSSHKARATRSLALYQTLLAVGFSSRRLLTAELLRLHRYSGRPLGFHYALALRLLTFPPHRTSPESDRRRCRWLPACHLSPLCRGFASKPPRRRRRTTMESSPE